MQINIEAQKIVDTVVAERANRIPTGWVNVLTGMPIYKDDPQHGLCPQCKTHNVISDQPSSERCLKCGWHDD